MFQIKDDFIKGFKAIIFDCDGTLVDSLDVHFRAWKQVFEEYGVKLPLSFLDPYNSIPSYKIAEDIIRIEGLDCSSMELALRKEDLLFESINLSKEIPRVSQIAKSYFGIMPLGVLSGGIRKNVLKSLQVTNLLHLFNVVFSADDSPNTKDGAEVWIEVSSSLGVDPKDCLVFEDGDKGIEGAKSAGMSVIDVRELID